MYRVFLLAGIMMAETVSFDSFPRHWTVAMTHEGGAPKWELAADPESSRRVLAQTSTDSTSGRFPLAIYDEALFTDGAVTVRFRSVAGERDQAAGIVWRYRDPDNYYIVRANALEDNVVLYKVERGKRIPLEPKDTLPKTYGVKHKVPKQTWSTLGVTFTGPRFTVSYDGVAIMEVEDSTFGSAGKTGLWTKADSVTYFDGFRIEKR